MNEILPLNTHVTTPDGRGAIIEQNVDRKRYIVMLNDGGIKEYTFDELEADENDISILVDTGYAAKELPEYEKNTTDRKNEPKVKITSDGRWSHTRLMVGDQHLRVDKLTISYDNSRDHSNKLKVEIEAYMPELDIEVLQRDTQLAVKKY